MKLRALIERLEEIEADLQSSLGDDVEPEVLCALFQPDYPLVGVLDGVAVLEDCDDGNKGDNEDAILINGAPIVWLAVGGHHPEIAPYAPSRVFEVAE